MKVKVFNLSYDAETGGFDSSELEGMGEEVEILSAQEHFFMQQGVPRMVVVVTYRDSPFLRKRGGQGIFSGPERKGERAGAKLEDAQDKALFETMRRWRAKQAKEDGIPAFVILNNEVLTEIVRQKPETRAALEAIQGFGKASMERYADVLLGFFRRPEESAGTEGGAALSAVHGRYVVIWGG